VKAAVAGAYPEGAVHYLMGYPVPEPMFNEDSWGNYLIWRLDGKRKVFVDTRTGLYEEAGVFQDFVRIMQVDSDTQTSLRKYGIESCLVGRGIPFATLLTVLPDWEQVYRDDLAVIFVRKTAYPEYPFSVFTRPEMHTRPPLISMSSRAFSAGYFHGPWNWPVLSLTH
jgi:hypothetical protein